MHSISPEVLKLFKDNYRQVVSITVRGYNKTYELTEANILQGGFGIDRYCVSGNKIELGSAVAGELTLKLDNRDDRFADEVFEGCELEVKVGIKKWNAYRWEKAQITWIPCGFFTVDEPPRKLSNISLTALDRMVRFDVIVNPADIGFPITVGNLLMKCCEICDVPLETLPTSLINSSYVINDCPEDDELTYRQLIQWIAEITGNCAYIDWNGKLRLEWYQPTDTKIDLCDRYTSQTYEQYITITGVQTTHDDGETEVKYLAGTDDYAFNIEANELIQHDHQSVVDAIFARVGGFSYLPMDCTTKPMPHVYPLDIVTFVDKHGVEHQSIITNVTFHLNQKTTLAGKGETNVKNGYATANPLTKGEAIVLKKLETRVNKKISASEQATLELNETLTNSLGLYRTAILEENGSSSFYYHNAPTLADSTVIYTFKANGFAWTDEWADDETVWNYGITKDGNAILNMLSVYKLTADYIDATELKVSAANITGQLTATQIDATELKVSAANITGKLTADSIDVNSLLVSGDFEEEIVSIINGTVTAQYIEAKGVTANTIRVVDSSNRVLFSAENKTVSIANFSVTNNSIQNITKQIVTVDNGDGSTANYSYNNGIKIMNDKIDIAKDGYSLVLEGGMINVGTPMLYSGGIKYFPLMSFYECTFDANGDRIPTGQRYYVCASYDNGGGFYVNPTWKIVITKSLNFTSSGDSGGSDDNIFYC